MKWICLFQVAAQTTTWMDLEGIMLNKIIQRQIPYDMTYMWNITKKKQTHRSREQSSDYQWGEGVGRGMTTEGLKRYNYHV